MAVQRRKSSLASRRTGFPVAAILLLGCPSFLSAASPEPSRLVVVLYPESSNGSPGLALADHGIRSTFASGRKQVEIQNEYLDVSRFPNAGYQQDLAKFLQRKYSARKVDLVIVGLASALDFALEHRERIFPEVPVVYCAVDRSEIDSRQLPADVIGVPIKMDLAASLALALRLHPETQEVYVVVGKSKFDSYWEAEARAAFRKQSNAIKTTYLVGLPMDNLLSTVKNLPEHSLIYYLHIFEDGHGAIHVPAEALEQLSAKANAPIYGHVDSYVGRGMVGGRVFSFEAEGRHAAELGLRVLAGERPERIGIQPTSENVYLFDWRQLKRWGIEASRLPPGSDIRFHTPTLWDRYRWQIIGLVSLCAVQALLIAAMLVQRSRRTGAEKRLRESREELREVTGRILGAQEDERRRIARELHDDFGQYLALLSVEMDLLRQRWPESSADAVTRMDSISARVKQLSSSIHNLSHQLHPIVLDQLGLEVAVRGLCNELTQNHGLHCKLKCDGLPGAVPREAALCLYRIAQEALRNVIKHSGARDAVVELHGCNGWVELRIRDTGAGFNPDAVAGQGGLGFVSMRERLRQVNGKLVIVTAISRGTRIEAHVPLPAGVERLSAAAVS
jgi:signal transduction histidine kinase